jgi:tetratricopeptide (TPR) repeat protein
MHLSGDRVAAFVEGSLGLDAMAEIRAHVSACASCSRQVMEAAQSRGVPLGESRPTDPAAMGHALGLENEPTISLSDPLKTSSENPISVDPSKPLEPGATVARYQILRHLASGGMGSVYAAYDADLDRRVALKVLRPRPAAGTGHDRLQMRLQREAKAMARLAHPNVVTVHDVGIFEGRVFVAMEYVDGLNLRQWLKAEKRPWQQIRDVFVQAGRGLAAAHAVGLIHRDFKPDNVLIGKDGRARVADFGLARTGDTSAEAGPGDHGASTDPVRPGVVMMDAPLTQAGRLLGTPGYMAPEQLRQGYADQRSDQFSFGVALYEALYRVKAFPKKDLLERLTAIESGKIQAAPPGHGVPEWLGQAVRKSLQADPAQRYPSMDAFLDALQRDAKRARLGAGGIVALAASAVAVAVGVYVARPDTRCKGAERRLAGVWDDARREQLKGVFQNVGAGGQAFEQTEKGLDEYARAWTTLHEEACTATNIRGEQTEAVLSLKMTCLDLRLRELRKMTALLSEADAKLAAGAAEAVLGLSSVRSCDDVATLTGRAPLPEDPAARSAISSLSEQLAEVNALRLAGQYPPALERVGGVIDQARPLKYRPLEAEALYQKAVLEERSGRRREAVEVMEAGVYAADSGRDDTMKARAAIRLVQYFSSQSKFDEGRRWGRVAQAALERLGGSAELEGDLASALGQMALNEGRVDEALELFERGRRLLSAEVGKEHPKTLNVSLNLASALTQTEASSKALEILRPTVEAMIRLRGADHPSLSSMFLTMAVGQAKLKDYPAAHASIDRCVAIVRARQGPDHVKVASCLEWKATFWQEQGKFADALETYQAALAIRRKSLAPSDPDLSYAYDGIGQSLLGLGRPADALAPLETALRLRGPSPSERADTQFALARALWESRKDRKRALLLGAQAKENYVRAAAPDKARRADAWLAARR